MSVDERREQIVRGRDGVKITMKMKIDLRARLDLGEPAAGRAAFHAEYRAERRLSRGDHHFLAEQS